MAKCQTDFLVCVKGPKCAKRGSRKLLKQLQRLIEEAGAESQFSVTQTKCLDLCGKGPAVVVMPDRLSYGKVKPKDCKKIIDTHAAGKKRVKRLALKKKAKKV